MVVLAIGRAVRLGFAVVFAVGVVACGGAQAPAASSSPSAPPASGPPTAWDSMSHDQKKDYMKKTFFPKMKDDFVAFDGKKYADMNCLTCHGDGATDGSFRMPNPNLPKLSPADGFKRHMDKTPAITKFMMSKVLTDSATLVGEPPYDPKTQQGFGCMECHTLEK